MATETRTLSAIDLTGIQAYIFGSNELRENVGASALPELAARDWLAAALDRAGARHNLAPDGTIQPCTLEDDPALTVEIVYRGGGNVIYQSRQRPHAVGCVRQLSRRLIAAAPGLTLAAAHRDFAWGGEAEGGEAIGGPAGVYAALLADLERAKQQRRAAGRALGSGVTVACRGTGQPAVDFDDRAKRDGVERPISAELGAKIAAMPLADCRLQDLLGDLGGRYTLSHDFDELGRSRGDQSYLAVVHADGNDLGRRFREVVERYPAASQNRACLTALRALSDAVARAGIAALGETLGALDAWLQGPPPANPREAWAWRELGGGAAGKPIFPVRPLIFGGDDVTLVCDGRLGLALAGRYLAAFAGAAVALPLGEDTRPAQACAGVAIVKVHYPFARAYALADALCGSAKSALRAEGLSQASALDWHIAAAGLDGTLEAIRAQGYTHKEAGDVTLRPVTAGPPGFGRWRSWGTVEALIAEFDQPDRWSRNKLLGLREQLVRGAEVTRAYRETFDLPSFEALAQHGGDAAATGWVAERCAAFDAIEAQDFWVALP